MLRPSRPSKLGLTFAIYAADDPRDCPKRSTSGVPPESHHAREVRSLDTRDHRPRLQSSSRQQQRLEWQAGYRCTSATAPRMPCRHRAIEWSEQRRSQSRIYFPGSMLSVGVANGMSAGSSSSTPSSRSTAIRNCCARGLESLRGCAKGTSNVARMRVGLSDST